MRGTAVQTKRARAVSTEAPLSGSEAIAMSRVARQIGSHRLQSVNAARRCSAVWLSSRDALSLRFVWCTRQRYLARLDQGVAAGVGPTAARPDGVQRHNAESNATATRAAQRARRTDLLDRDHPAASSHRRTQHLRRSTDHCVLLECCGREVARGRGSTRSFRERQRSADGPRRFAGCARTLRSHRACALPCAPSPVAVLLCLQHGHVALVALAVAASREQQRARALVRSTE